MDVVKVPGENKRHRVRLYALSTCIWCRRTKSFLKDNKVEYEYVDVDLCSREDREKIKNEVLEKGGRLAFPVTIIDDEKVITGYRVDKLKEVLEIDNP
ncbi:MAG: glutaredoxin family protein [Candidatus Freyarchaeota archaeon]